MKAPRRYLDDPGAPEDVRALLKGGPSAPPPMPPEVRAAIGRRVAAAGAGVGVGTFLLKLGKAALLVGALGGVYLALRAPAESRRSGDTPVHALGSAASVAEPLAGAVHVPVPQATQEPTASPAVAPDPLEAQPSAPALRVRRTGPMAPMVPEVAAPTTPEAPTDDLLREAALLERARAELGRHPRSALSTARSHSTLFPQGQLAAERQLIVAEALIELGRFPDARRILRPLSESGLYTERAQRLLTALESDSP